MYIKKSVLIILFFLLCLFSAYSNQNSQPDSSNKTLEDSNLTGSQHCRPGYGPFFYKQSLGNLGSAFRSVNFWDDEKEFFNHGINQFKIYEFSEAMNNDLPKRGRFSELKYVAGSKKEQNFSIKHFQRLTKEISFGLDFRIAHSSGFYNKQVSDFKNFNLFTRFHSRNGKYNLLLNYLSNKIVSQENGGLTNDSSFEFAGSFDSKVTSVNFNDVKNQHKSKIFYLEQRYNFFSKDSLDSTSIPRKQFYINHVFKYGRKSMRFTADTFYDSFFDHAYYDTTATYDSLFVKNLYNEISMNVNFNARTTFYLAADHQYFNFYQEDTADFSSGSDTVLQNISVKPGGNIEWENGLGINFYFQKSFNDLQFDFYKTYASVYFNQKEKNRFVKLEAEHSVKNPDFIFNYYNSNHFIWFNQFHSVDFSKAEVTAQTKFVNQLLRVSADIFSVRGLTYFDSDALPRQFHERINVFNVYLFHSIRFGKFNLLNNFKYQNADKKEIIKLPDFSSYTSFFYENDFFKKALYAQFGFDIRYCTLYFADAYMPATGQFYLQDEKEIGNYAYADVFANFRIKSFRFFLKVEHLNAGFTERLYYTVPHYPMPGRSFKFGVVWQFFD